MTINGLDEDQLVIRYANNYSLPKETLSFDMVLKHWNLEKALTKKLLESTPENRKLAFYEAYNRLYHELPWLQKTGSMNELLSEKIYLEKWQPMLGDVRGKKIYEIGSGNGQLINCLATRGAICVATELSEERPDKQPRINLEWHATDGVHLTEYEQKDFYDYTISDQVIEHLHPDDIALHLEKVQEILRPGGCYILQTPHYYIGPGDVSRIFGCEEAEGMHLKEYKYAELYKLLRAAGFRNVGFPLLANPGQMLSGTRLKLFLLLEQSLQLGRGLKIRKRIYHRLRRMFHLPGEIVIYACK